MLILRRFYSRGHFTRFTLDIRYPYDQVSLWWHDLCGTGKDFQSMDVQLFVTGVLLNSSVGSVLPFSSQFKGYFHIPDHYKDIFSSYT